MSKQNQAPSSTDFSQMCKTVMLIKALQLPLLVEQKSNYFP